MVPEIIVRQMVHFQKTSFDNLFNAVVMAQDQSAGWFHKMMAQTTWIPDEAQRLAFEWTQVCNRYRTDFKAMIDEGYVQMATLFGNLEPSEASNPNPENNQ